MLSKTSCVDDVIHPSPSAVAGGHAPKEVFEESNLYRLVVVDSRSVEDGF